MSSINEDTITQAVLRSFSECRDQRAREVMTSLVQHLHSFARDVRLTEPEWFAAIGFLRQCGDFTDAKRQEFILLSDTLGLSMLVAAQNNPTAAGSTEATVFGPFFVEGAPEMADGADISNGAIGQPCWVRSDVRGTDGEPIAGAVIDVWQADGAGQYDVQDVSLDGHRSRGRFTSGADGNFMFKTTLPVPYQIPSDGPVGKMLGVLGRHAWRPAHLHFMIVAAGYKRLITHLFRQNDPYLDSDAVFGVRASLIADWAHHDAAFGPDGSPTPQGYWSIDHRFVLDRP